jgi:hypothetical protein
MPMTGAPTGVNLKKDKVVEATQRLADASPDQRQERNHWVPKLSLRTTNMATGRRNIQRTSKQFNHNEITQEQGG